MACTADHCLPMSCRCAWCSWAMSSVQRSPGVDVEQAIRSDRVTRYVSVLAAIPDVRTWVNARSEGGGGSGRWWMEGPWHGRDIGTVVFPEAPLKIFLTATPDERPGGGYFSGARRSMWSWCAREPGGWRPGCGRFQPADRPPQTRSRGGFTRHDHPDAGAAGDAGR